MVPEISWTGRSVLVTGAAGFIGANLARRLLDGGARVTALVRPGTDLWRIEEIRDRLAFVEADLGALDSRADVPGWPAAEIVFHLAAAGVAPGAPGGAALWRTNVLGTRAVLERAREGRAACVVVAGSCFEYGEGDRLEENTATAPLEEYGASKAAASILALAYGRVHGLPVTILRPFTAYGPFEAPFRLVASTLLSCLAGRDVALAPGRKRRDFIHVDDITDAFLAAAAAPAAAGQAFNVCTGAATDVRRVAERLIAVSRAAVRSVPGAMASRAADREVLSGSPDRIRDALGWISRVSLEEGLSRTAAWFIQNAGRYAAYRLSA